MVSVAGDRLSVSGKWPPSYAGRSINSLELEAVLLALHEFSRHLRQVILLILSDNLSSQQGGGLLLRPSMADLLASPELAL